MDFESAEELKQRVMPALKMKEEEFKNKGYDISLEEIWFYLKQNKWCHSRYLTLNEVVNDILKLEDTAIKH